MIHGKRTLATALLAAASLTTAASLRAQTFTETTDAGQTLATVLSTAGGALPAGTTLTQINGNLTGATGLDADLYAIRITTPGSFSATVSTTLDTAIFLFSASGVAIATNDDVSGTSFASGLSAGNALYNNLPVGTYYLGISLSGNEPVNTANQLLFAGYTAGDSTSIRGAAAGTNPTTLSAFNNLPSFPEAGAYSIALAGAATAVPEPSTYAMFAFGTAASLGLIRRLRRQQEA